MLAVVVMITPVMFLFLAMAIVIQGEITKAKVVVLNGVLTIILLFIVVGISMAAPLPIMVYCCEDDMVIISVEEYQRFLAAQTNECSSNA